MLFSQTIKDVESWVDVYQSTEAFGPLVKEIFSKHGLICTGIKNLMPGSNAVFLADEFIIKIFAPIEAGFSTGKGFFIEKAALKHANGTIPSPKLLYSGTIDDKYSFQYIIMDFIGGQEFIEKRKGYTNDEKRSFASIIKVMTNAINVPVTDIDIPAVTRNDCIENQRWSHFPKSFCEDRISIINKMSFDDCVYVHGDIKAANIIINEDGIVYMIDYADSHIAPAAYEWPFIVFGLFGCDREMMETYFGDYKNEAFYMCLTRHLLMHKFGAFILLQICDLSETRIDSIVNVMSLYKLIKECVQNGNMLIE